MRIQALNIYGWSDFQPSSDPYFTVKASGIPLVMSSATVEYDSVDPTFVRIAWTPPHDNSEALTEYSVLIESYNGEYFETAECAHLTALQTECLVALTTLKTAPYSLEFDNPIRAKVRAENLFGVAEFYSQPNVVGARVQAEPNRVGQI